MGRLLTGKLDGQAMVNKQSRTFQPRVEALEDRLTPSSTPVTTTPLAAPTPSILSVLAVSTPAQSAESVAVVAVYQNVTFLPKLLDPAKPESVAVLAVYQNVTFQNTPQPSTRSTEQPGNSAGASGLFSTESLGFMPNPNAPASRSAEQTGIRNGGPGDNSPGGSSFVQDAGRQTNSPSTGNQAGAFGMVVEDRGGPSLTFSAADSGRSAASNGNLPGRPSISFAVFDGIAVDSVGDRLPTRAPTTDNPQKPLESTSETTSRSTNGSISPANPVAGTVQARAAGIDNDFRTGLPPASQGAIDLAGMSQEDTLLAQNALFSAGNASADEGAGVRTWERRILGGVVVAFVPAVLLAFSSEDFRTSSFAGDQLAGAGRGKNRRNRSCD